MCVVIADPRLVISKQPKCRSRSWEAADDRQNPYLVSVTVCFHNVPAWWDTVSACDRGKERAPELSLAFVRILTEFMKVESSRPRHLSGDSYLLQIILLEVHSKQRTWEKHVYSKNSAFPPVTLILFYLCSTSCWISFVAKFFQEYVLAQEFNTQRSLE